MYESSVNPQPGEPNLAGAQEYVLRTNQLTGKLVSGFTELYANPGVDLGARVKELKQLEK